MYSFIDAINEQIPYAELKHNNDFRNAFLKIAPQLQE